MDVKDKNQEFMAILSANLRRVLATKNWPVRRLAEESGEDYAVTNRAVNGKRCVSAAALVRFAAALQVSLDDLVDATGCWEH